MVDLGLGSIQYGAGEGSRLSEVIDLLWHCTGPAPDFVEHVDLDLSYTLSNTRLKLKVACAIASRITGNIQKMISRLDVTAWSRNPVLAQVVLVLAVISLINHAQCANYTVGEGFVESGNGYTWTNTVGGLLKPTLLEGAYQQWASSVKVTAGDILTFDYPLGSHTVFLVSTEVAFTQCDFTGAVQVPDGFPTTYTIKSTDTALYFVCNIPGHCLQGGQKVKVTPVGTGTLSPPSGSKANNALHQSLSGVTIVFLLILSSTYLASSLIL